MPAIADDRINRRLAMTSTGPAPRRLRALAVTVVSTLLASVSVAEDPAPLEHRSVPGDDRSTVWSPASLAARYEALSLRVASPEPTVNRDEQESMRAALDLMTAGDVDGAIETLEKFRNDDSSAMLEFTLANFHFGQARFETASEAYERAVTGAPGFRRAWMQLGLARVQQGRFEEARAALARAMSLGAADAVTSGLVAFANANLGDPLVAEEAYRQAVLLDPKTLDWKRGLVLTFFTGGRYAEAAALLGRLVREDPDNPDWWMFQANAFLGMQRPADAARNFEVVRGLGAATPESLSMLGNIYVNDGLPMIAVERYLEAISSSSEPDPKAVFQAADLMLRRNELAEATALVEGVRACCFDGFDAERRKSLLKLEAKIAGRRQDAVAEAAVLEQLVEIDPADGESMILLGEYHARQPDGLETAFGWFEKAAAIPETSAKALLQHGQTLVRAGRLDEAVPYLDRSLAIEDRAAVRTYRDGIVDYLERTGG
jgi:tetratricopeptide (TPR) repeat protein